MLGVLLKNPNRRKRQGIITKKRLIIKMKKGEKREIIEL